MEYIQLFLGSLYNFIGLGDKARKMCVTFIDELQEL